MRIKTTNELFDKLANEIQWRKKELVDYKFIVENNRSSTRVTPLIRGGIALGYAHWEGFIKMSSSYYINYISTIKIPLDEVEINFLALSYMKRINKGNNISDCILLIEELLNGSQKPCKIYDKDIIETKSNLKFHVLKNILTSLGLDQSHFQAKENFLDKKLVDIRNDIAHGTYRDLSYEDFQIVHSNIIPLLEYYKTLIENSATLKSYRK